MRRVIQLSVAALLLASSCSVASAAESKQSAPPATTKPNTTTSATVNPNYVFPIQNKMKISTNSYAQLTDINLGIADDYNVLTYTINLYNGDKTSIQLLDYWVRVRSKTTGETYTSSLATEDKDKSQVLPKSSVTLKFYAKLDKSVKLTDLKFELVKWDFSLPDYTKKLGEVSVPANFSPNVKPTQYKTVKVNDVPVRMNLQNFAIVKLENSNLFSISLQMQNTGTRTLNAPKYKFSIRSDKGISYPLTSDASQDLSIQPKETKTINLGANIPSDPTAKNWVLQIEQQDETAKVDLGIATFQLPQSTTDYNLVGTEDERIISVNNTKVGVKVKYASLLENNSDRTVSVTISITNRDSKSVTLPQYAFELFADGGYAFPMPTGEGDNNTVTLNPMQEKTYSLKAVIPSSITVEKPQVLIEQQVSGGTSDGSSGTTNTTMVPIAVFKLDQLNANQTVKSTYIDTLAGSYLVTMDSVQRLPWADNDVLVAHFKIKNYSFVKSLPVPNLTGYISLDGIKAADADTQFILADNVTTLAPNSEVNGYLITKVPYYNEYNVIQAGLQEKISDTVNREVAQFVTTSTSDALPEVAAQSGYDIPFKGKESTIRTRKTNVYPGTGSNLLYTEVEIDNLGTRQSNLPQLVGYFTSGNGDYYKATISQPQQAVQANGKGIVAAWATVPRTADLSKFKLLIGEGVKDSKLAEPKEESNSYVNGILMGIPADVAEPSTTLLNMDFFPYSFSIRSFEARLTGGGGLMVNMDYDLTRNLDYQVDSYDHKVLLQIMDTSSGHMLEKEIDFSELTEGQHGYSYSLSDSSLDDTGYGVYTLNVYDLFQGQKKLIGKQSLYYTSSSSNSN